MNPIEIFTALDLEMNQPSGKIIQIGAVVGNIHSGEIIEKLSVIVNPGETLNPYIIELTGIKQELVDKGFSLNNAYMCLRDMHTTNKAFINPITWGGGDQQTLLEQLKQETEFDYNWCFGRRHIDAKTLFVSWRLANKLPIQGGLAKSMTKVGLKFEGRKHDALADSLNTFQMYRKLLVKLQNPEISF